MKFKIYIILLLFTALLTACSKDKNKPELADKNTIPNVVSDNFNLAIFSTALNRSGLTDKLNEPGPFTVLAPSDAAYIAAGFSKPSAILTAPIAETVVQTTYHALEGKFRVAGLALQMNKALTSLGGTKVYLSRAVKNNDTITTVNGARILRADINASNGTVHVIDRLLEPVRFSKLVAAISGQVELTLFYQALLRAGLLNTLNQDAFFTIFAPTNAAVRSYGYADIEAINAASPTELSKWLRFHIAANLSFTQDYFLRAEAGQTVYQTAMLDGGMLKINLMSQSNVPNSFTGITVQGNGNNGQINVVQRDILTGNGIIHIISGVLVNN